MLKVVNLCAGYEEIQILKNVNLHINKNEIVALIGPNVAGKSTVLRSIFGLAKIKKGDILFQEMSILNKKPHELIKERICYVNQGKIVFDHLTVLENLQIGTKQENINNNKTLERVYHQFPVLFKKQENLAKGLSGGE